MDIITFFGLDYRDAALVKLFVLSQESLLKNKRNCCEISLRCTHGLSVNKNRDATLSNC